MISSPSVKDIGLTCVNLIQSDLQPNEIVKVFLSTITLFLKIYFSFPLKTAYFFDINSTSYSLNIIDGTFPLIK